MQKQGWAGFGPLVVGTPLIKGCKDALPSWAQDNPGEGVPLCSAGSSERKGSWRTLRENILQVRKVSLRAVN